MTPTYYLAVRLLAGNILTMQGPQQGEIRAIRPVEHGAPDLLGADRPQYVGWLATDATQEQVNILLEPVMNGEDILYERKFYVDFDLVPDEIEEQMLMPEIVQVDFITLQSWLVERS